MHIDLVKDKVIVKIYNRSFKESSHYYLLKDRELEEVQNNHDSVVKDLKASHLCVINQVHGIVIEDANKTWKIGEEPKADGMITNTHGFVLGIQTADCVPVLIASEDGTIIGGAHCGWKSAAGGILKELANKMRAKTNAKLLAIIGPSIQQKSYEVDDNFYNEFIKNNQENSVFFIKTGDTKYHFDLPAYVKKQLNDLNITLAYHFNDDTYELPDLYPSHRYSTHCESQKYKGSILSTISII